MAIQRVAVLGSGVMGSGIAAHVANAGVPVTLLDLPSGEDSERSAIAAGAVARMLRTEPAPLMSPRAARLVEPGNFDDDLGRLADADWIVEAVVERLEVKRALYERVDAVRKPGSIVSSNTSTIPLSLLVEGRPESFRRDFLITHFFNPPRYMRLLELVAGPDTRPEAVEAARDFCDVALGKGVVDCKDTPGFIANRIGCYWLQVAAVEAMALGLSVEEADAVASRPMGVPRTGVFGLLDLVGIDLMPEVIASLGSVLADGDAFHDYGEIPALFRRMIDEGYTGRKGKGGFYRRAKDAQGQRVREVIDLSTGEYRAQAEPRLDSLEAARAGGLDALLKHPDRGGRYAWTLLSRTLAYTASLVPEIVDEPAAVDAAMRLGYSWRQGPFELIDAIGPERLAEGLAADGIAVPALLSGVGAEGFYRVRDERRECVDTAGAYHPLARPAGVLLLGDVKLAAEPLARNGSAALWDLGDGVACFEIRTKMNAIDADVLALLARAPELLVPAHRALVIHSEGDQFSVGVNLGLALFAANTAAWDEITRLVEMGQQVYRALEQAPFPVVGAPAGMALGGGMELLLRCDAVVAHAETYMGLVEVGVGLIPAWGGCAKMLERWSANERRPGGPMPPVQKVFETVGLAAVARSAVQGRDHLFLRPADEIVPNRDRVLARAKARALELAPDYRAPEPAPLHLPGPSARAGLDLAVAALARQGKATPHDVVVSAALARVLSGGDTDVTEEIDESALLALEREAFLSLVREPATLARMEHMLETGRPLRN